MQSFPTYVQIPFSADVPAMKKGGAPGGAARSTILFADTFRRDGPADYLTSSIFTTFSYIDRIGIRQPYFQILTFFPFRRMASFWMVPESNLNR